MTDAEKQMGQQLRLLETKLHALSQSMESLKRREQLCGVKVKSFIGMSRFAMQTNVFFFYAQASQQQDPTATQGHLSEEQMASVNEALALQ